MSLLNSDYAKVVEISERTAWRINDVFPPGTALDFSKLFMPKAMFAADTLDFLNADELRKLNQIYGNAYAYIFYFVEAYITEMATGHAQAAMHGDEHELRAMLRFAEEEVKHQQMFMRFREMFRRGFGSDVDLVPNPEAVAHMILGKVPMAVLLVTLHIEIITQAHFIDCMRDDKEIEPHFANLFKHHWLEEAQHAQLDALQLIHLRRSATPGMVEQTIDEYFEVTRAFGEVLAAQGKLDVGNLERATGRTFTEEQRAALEVAQRKSYQYTFLRSGFTNSSFLEFLAEHFPAAIPGAATAAAALA
jgi:hypothetical protein